MQLQHQLVSVRFGEQEQQHGSKLLRIPGQISNAQDVFQKKTGVYQQRNGKAALNTTTDTGSITTGNSLSVSGGDLVLRTNDTVFARATTAAKWINKGAHSDAFMSWQEIVPNFGTRPTSVAVGANTWWFIYNKSSHVWWYTVTETATGVVILPLTATTLTEATQFYGWGKPIVAGGFVWLLYIQNTSVVKAAKFNPASPASAPTVTTYDNANGGGAVNGIDVMQTPTGYPLVVLYSTTSGNGTQASFLDYATGLPKASPGVVSYASTLSSSGCILRGADGSNGSFYVARVTTSSPTILNLDSTTLALTATDITTLGTATGSASNSLSGYWDGTNKVIFYSHFAETGSFDPENAVIIRIVKPAGAATASYWTRSRSVVTTPIQVGSSWYVVTNHDDNKNLQRAYYLQDAVTGRIMARTLYQLGGDLAQRGGFLNTSAVAGLDFGWVTPNPVVSGTAVTFPAVANTLGTSDFQTMAITLDLAPALGPMVTSLSGGVALIPGGWPMAAASDSAFIEQAPAMYPRTLSSQAGGGTTWPSATFGFCIVYTTVAVDGAVSRSAPSATFSFAGGAALFLKIPTNRTSNATVGQYIEIYATLAGGLDFFLYATILNDPTVDYVVQSVPPGSSYGELLYTSGNTLSNIAPPPHKVSIFWKDRQIVTDTDIPGEIWPSKEISSGFGISFSDISIVRIPGRHRALGVVDENYLAVFQADGINVLFGTGQTDTGSGGNFKKLKLPWTLGTTNPASVVTGPQGCFFQGTDGGIYLVDRGLQVAYAGAGVDDHKAATVTSAVHVQTQRHIRFFLNSGKVLVLDYGNTESNPLGKWYVWTNHNAVAATVSGGVCYHVDSTGVVRQEVDGQTYDDTNTPILPKIQVATISFAGLLGYQRCYRGQFEGEYRGQHSLKITATPDFTGTPQVFGPRVVSSAPEEFEFKPTQSRLTALDITIERTGTDTTDSFTFEGLAFEVGIRPGMRRLNTSQRIT